MGRHAVAPVESPEDGPRCLTRQGAAKYLGISVPSLDRLVYAGQLPVVRLPAFRDRFTHTGRPGAHRRVLIDVQDLDALIDRSKQRR